MFDVILYAEELALGKKSVFHISISDEQKEELRDNVNFIHLCQLIGDFTSIKPGDFGRVANWGFWRGEPVIIDVGFTTESAKLYGQ